MFLLQIPGEEIGKFEMKIAGAWFSSNFTYLYQEKENCTVKLAHSRTKDLEAECRQADIVVAAVGVEEIVRGEWIKPGATVIDVGINRVQASDGKYKLVGDVNFSEAVKVPGAITPVPGGVGPMTIACLLRNTLDVTLKQNNINLEI